VRGHASRTAPVRFARARTTPRLLAAGGGCRGSRGPSDSRLTATDSEDQQRPGSDGEGAIAAWANQEYKGRTICVQEYVLPCTPRLNA
jgi:hypothetical protein